jgi:hypothetical protein
MCLWWYSIFYRILWMNMTSQHPVSTAMGKRSTSHTSLQVPETQSPYLFIILLEFDRKERLFGIKDRTNEGFDDAYFMSEKEL